MSNMQRFGWIPPEDRTFVQQQAWEDAFTSMPKFQITGKANDDAKRAVLWDCSKAVVNADPSNPNYENGHFKPFRQITGSCVGQGLGKAVWYLSVVEVVRLNDPELSVLPFFLLAYGRSRFYMGDRGRGDGSLGSTAAKAAKEDGFIPASLSGLPQPTDSNGLTWGEEQEYKWSDGDDPDNMKWLDQSRKHLVRTVSPVRSAADVRTAMQNYFPVTIASNWGGLDQARVEGTPPVLLSRKSGSWAHQMSVNGWWEHPTIGEIYHIDQSWGKNPHGVDPSDAPPGGFWVKTEDMDYIARQDDSFAFSQFQGFPAPEPAFLDWIKAFTGGR